MSEVLHFIFRDFWTWLGSFLLVCVLSRFSLVRVSVMKKQQVNSPSTDNSVTNQGDE